MTFLIKYNVKPGKLLPMVTCKYYLQKLDFSLDISTYLFPEVLRRPCSLSWSILECIQSGPIEGTFCHQLNNSEMSITALVYVQ